MKHETPENGIYGLMASFEGPHDLLVAAQKTREEGFDRVDAFTPFPVEGLPEAVGARVTKVPAVVFLGALAGCLSGIFLQYACEVLLYPKNVGGRPLWSWPAYIPAAYELTILVGSFAALIGMIVLNGLPMPYHPVFNVPQFRTVSRDGFFLCIESSDPKFDLEQTKRFLETLNPRGVFEVER